MICLTICYDGPFKNDKFDEFFLDGLSLDSISSHHLQLLLQANSQGA